MQYVAACNLNAAICSVLVYEFLSLCIVGWQLADDDPENWFRGRPRGFFWGSSSVFRAAAASVTFALSFVNSNPKKGIT
ncbi:unnamed protein product [Cuscuta campestris]|uniref:Uncharacterized protein n=1 Tax=Cuscuta campestris TaxID=132261 RepID=A0A484MLI8_9ASTE|nr:unnamed protein product [Cuscuta campestris]